MKKICSLPKCDRQVKAQNLCKKHVQAHYNNQLWNALLSYQVEDADGVVTKKRIMNGFKPRVDEPTYLAWHKRLRKDLGHASYQQCVVGNDHAAMDWSLDPGTATHKTWNNLSQRWYPYSLNVDDYSPRCRHHHRIMDAGRSENMEVLITTEPVSMGGGVRG